MDVEPLSGLLTLFGGHCPDTSGHNLAADVHSMITIEGLVILGNDRDCCAKLRRNFVFAVDVFRSLFVPQMELLPLIVRVSSKKYFCWRRSLDWMR